MGQNAYFQLIQKENKVWLKVFPQKDGGEPINADEIILYLDRVNMRAYDVGGLTEYLRRSEFGREHMLCDDNGVRETELVIIQVDGSAVNATARFYPPSLGGKQITKADVLLELSRSGVVHGIDEAVIDSFFQNRRYCTDYVVAKSTPPVQGHDAEITYYFDTNVTAKPKLNEDGSVDFHKLGNIKPINKGDVLAILDPADRGTPGMNVMGGPLQPKKVRIKRLRFGRNISISEDRLKITSDVSGHVTLVDDLVMVSDIYSVPKDVDASTGDIEYNGTVEVSGNVLTGYAIKAKGDIIVNGVVEGACLEADGNIVLKNGMQGMSRGRLKAKGNVIAKYLENCTVESDGEVMSDAIMHSRISAKGDVKVSGRKGLVTGGFIKTFGNIIVANAGSSMGTDTVLEILPDTEVMKRCRELQEEIEEKVEQGKKMDQVIMKVGQLMKAGVKITAEQENYVRIANLNRKKLLEELEILNASLSSLQLQLVGSKNVSIQVQQTVYAGTKIVIKNIMKIVKETVVRAKFVREGADIQITSL